ncbi:hypothetical protein CBL_05700 [Carabus blaptoides fortunei]
MSDMVLSMSDKIPVIPAYKKGIPIPRTCYFRAGQLSPDSNSARTSIGRTHSTARLDLHWNLGFLFVHVYAVSFQFVANAAFPSLDTVRRIRPKGCPPVTLIVLL